MNQEISLSMLKLSAGSSSIFGPRLNIRASSRRVGATQRFKALKSRAKLSLVGGQALGHLFAATLLFGFSCIRAFSSDSVTVLLIKRFRALGSYGSEFRLAALHRPCSYPATVPVSSRDAFRAFYLGTDVSLFSTFNFSDVFYFSSIMYVRFFI